MCFRCLMHCKALQYVLKGPCVCPGSSCIRPTAVLVARVRLVHEDQAVTQQRRGKMPQYWEVAKKKKEEVIWV